MFKTKRDLPVVKLTDCSTSLNPNTIVFNINIDLSQFRQINNYKRCFYMWNIGQAFKIVTATTRKHAEFRRQRRRNFFDRFPTDYRRKQNNLKSSEFRRLISTNFRENKGRRNISTTFRRHSDKKYNRCSRRKVVGKFRRISDDIPIKKYNRYGRRYSVGIFRRISDEPSDRCRQIYMTVL